MNQLKAGFSIVNVTPMMGIGVAGYYQTRLADGVLDDLYLRVLALEYGDRKVLLFSMDICDVLAKEADILRQDVAAKTGVSADAIFISATHTHTGPFVKAGSDDALLEEYFQLLRHKYVDAAMFALADLKPAKLGYGIGKAENVAFVRRFRMKDGSIQTNPGVGNPNIDSPIGDVDERVNVLRFDREGAESLVLVNFGNHPDVVGGCKISADWPGFLCKFVEKSIDNTRCLFFNGAQGDVNHVNVNAKGGDFNDMFNDFDDVARGYGHARHMGRVVAGAVMQVYDKVNYVNVDSLRYLQKVIKIPANLPTAEELPKAREIEAMHQAGRDAELPYKGMMLTTVVAEAERMLNLEHGPEYFELRMSGVSLGGIALLGIPGEAFTGIGRELKKAAGWDLVLPCGLTNGCEGYFPMQEAYDEGGYESRSSPFKAGVAELVTKEGLALLDELHTA